SGQVQSVPFMHREASIPYYADAELEATDLWYGNGAFSMTILLPRAGKNVDALAVGLDLDRWNRIVAGLTEAKLSLALPNLRLEYKRTLSDDLRALGMARAFDPDRADFSGISTAQGLYLTRVEHKTFVDINEVGTEAGAATAVGVGTTSAGPSFVVDRPFLFAI